MFFLSSIFPSLVSKQAYRPTTHFASGGWNLPGLIPKYSTWNNRLYLIDFVRPLLVAQLLALKALEL